MAQVLEEITLKNSELMKNLSSFTDINRLVEEIDQLESSADRMFRRVTGELFSGSHDALDILRWKEIVEAIERSIDAVEEVSDVVQTIAVKHS